MPDPFKFRLEVVQRLRKLELDRAQRAMAGCLNAVMDAQRLAELVTERMRDNERQKREAQARRRPDIASLRAAQLHALWLQRLEDQTNRELTTRREIMDAQRRKLVDASRRVKVIEKLKARQVRRYQDALRRTERRGDDEFAMLIAKRDGENPLR